MEENHERMDKIPFSDKWRQMYYMDNGQWESKKKEKKNAFADKCIQTHTERSQAIDETIVQLIFSLFLENKVAVTTSNGKKNAGTHTRANCELWCRWWPNRISGIWYRTMFRFHHLIFSFLAQSHENKLNAKPLNQQLVDAWGASVIHPSLYHIIIILILHTEIICPIRIFAFTIHNLHSFSSSFSYSKCTNPYPYTAKHERIKKSFQNEKFVWKFMFSMHLHHSLPHHRKGGEYNSDAQHFVFISMCNFCFLRPFSVVITTIAFVGGIGLFGSLYGSLSAFANEKKKKKTTIQMIAWIVVEGCEVSEPDEHNAHCTSLWPLWICLVLCAYTIGSQAIQ